MSYNEICDLILEEKNIDTDFYAFPPKAIADFRTQVFADGKVGKSHEILWRPCNGDTIRGYSRRSDHFPKTLDLQAFYKATTIPLTDRNPTYPLNGSNAPTIRLNVIEGPYKEEYSNHTCYYGIFPPTHNVKRNLSPETKQTFNDIIDEL